MKFQEAMLETTTFRDLKIIYFLKLIHETEGMVEVGWIKYLAQQFKHHATRLMFLSSFYGVVLDKEGDDLVACISKIQRCGKQLSKRVVFEVEGGIDDDIDAYNIKDDI